MSTSHESWVDGSEQNENIADWLNYGHGGIVEYEGQYFIELATEQLKKELPKKIEKAIKEDV